jgi:hypothetical protein
MTTRHAFTAYLSGHHDDFYFAVPLDEALAFGINPELLDPCPHHPGCVAVYPHHLWTDGTALRFEITTTAIKATPQYDLVQPSSHTTIARASAGRLDV